MKNEHILGLPTGPFYTVYSSPLSCCQSGTLQEEPLVPFQLPIAPRSATVCRMAFMWKAMPRFRKLKRPQGGTHCVNLQFGKFPGRLDLWIRAFKHKSVDSQECLLISGHIIKANPSFGLCWNEKWMHIKFFQKMDESFWVYEMQALDPSWMESPSSSPKGRWKKGGFWAVSEHLLLLLAGCRCVSAQLILNWYSEHSHSNMSRQHIKGIGSQSRIYKILQCLSVSSLGPSSAWLFAHHNCCPFWDTCLLLVFGTNSSKS